MRPDLESQLKKYRGCMKVIDRCASTTSCETCKLYVPADQVKLFGELDALIEGQ